MVNALAAADKLADAYYWHGVDALNIGAFDQAINDFELALFEDPSHRGAQIDLVVAVCQTTDVQRCDVELIRLAEKYPNNPTMRNLESILAPKRWHHFTQLAVGNSNNINQGLATQQLALTVNGLPVNLNVSPQSLAKSSSYTDITHHSQWQSSSLPNRWELQFQAYSRQLSLLNDNQLMFGQLVLKKRQAMPFTQQYWAWGMGITRLDFQQQYVYTAPKLLLEWEMGDLLWQPKWQYQREVRYFEPQGEAVLDTLGVSLTPIESLTLQVNRIQDSNNERLGGDTSRWQWQAMWQQSITNSVTLQLLAYGLLSQDDQMYAFPVVEEKRSTRQQGWQIGLQYTLSQQWFGQCAWRNNQQIANHPLFEWQESGWQCGLLVVY